MIRYTLPGSAQLIVLRSEVAEHIAAHRQMRIWHREAGGQLFGTFEGGDVVIRLATGPRAGDRRWRYGFEPDRAAERREILVQHAAGLHFVGDWHTHPQAVPFPSGRDLASIADCFRRSEHRLGGFLLLIAGRKEGPEGLYVAFCDAKHHRRLKAVPDTRASARKGE